MKVTVLYDFGSEIENELSIICEYFRQLNLTYNSLCFFLHYIAGEIITVTDKDVGNGWWEGLNSKGRRGIFPASCELINIKKIKIIRQV